MGESCCASDDATPQDGGDRRCPLCQHPGRPVATLLVRAMLAVSLRRVSPTDSYSFCSTPACPVAYFAPGHHFTTAELREAVHQKQPDEAQVPVCYCFGHTPGSICAEWQTTGQSTVVADVTAGIRAGQCACEIRNPQGSCCLGNVRAVVQRLTGNVPEPRP